MVMYEALLSGPSLHFWFNAVFKVLPKQDVITTVKKMFLGQTVYGPIMNVVFFSFNDRLQGETGEEIIARLKRELFPTLKSRLASWSLCDFITFRFVPIHLQPLISNSFSYAWTINITYMASLKKGPGAGPSAGLLPAVGNADRQPGGGEDGKKHGWSAIDSSRRRLSGPSVTVVSKQKNPVPNDYAATMNNLLSSSGFLGGQMALLGELLYLTVTS